MRVIFRTNLGSVDAEPLGLDCKACAYGETVSVSDEIGMALIDSGIAEAVAEPKAKMQGVSPKPAIAEVSEAKTIKAETK